MPATRCVSTDAEAGRGIPAGFAGATQFVRPEDAADTIPCGPGPDAIVEAVSAYWAAGFTDIVIVQVGDEGQDRFLEVPAGPLLEELRSAAPAGAAQSGAR